MKLIEPAYFTDNVPAMAGFYRFVPPACSELIHPLRKNNFCNMVVSKPDCYH
jgi:hypothetical protein